MFSILASGSSDLDGMLIVPCTMGTIGKINAGTSDNLLIRSADVMMKEGKPLVIVPRETPFSTLHLRNLHSLSSLGVKIVPPIPSFYDKPNTIDDLVGQSVGRIIKAMGVSNELYNRWSGGND
jgi:4-hydroxy-3-polyprenylbenzoate decarboxylase